MHTCISVTLQHSVTMHRSLGILFSGLQALSAVVLMALAVWAAFFTSLPEALFTQLRSEISEAKSEIEELRRVRLRLEDERRFAEEEARRIQAEVARLRESDIALQQSLEEKRAAETILKGELLALRSVEASLNQEVQELLREREQLRTQLTLLANERAKYGTDQYRLTVDQLTALACYRIRKNLYFSRIASGYPLHRAWLNANRELERLEPEYERLSFEDKYSSKNELASRFRKLKEEAISPPDIWLGEPTPPQLIPSASDPVLPGSIGTLLNAIGAGPEGYRSAHDQLINFFFDNTVLDRGARAQTIETFVSALVNETLLRSLLSEEADSIRLLFEGFLSETQLLQENRISINFNREPSANEIPIGAQQIEENLFSFHDSLWSFLRENGFPNITDCEL